MLLISYIRSLLFYAMVFVQLLLLISCGNRSYNSKHQVGKIGFRGLYLDMEYVKAKNTKDSLLKISELRYLETTDVLGNEQKSLFSDLSEISPTLCARVNLRGSIIIDERLTSIQLTLCSKSNTGDKRILYSCDINELNRLFELYREKYGTPTALDRGEQYDWLSKRISNVYFPGPKGRWLTDKIYFWEKGNYIIYFDFGYPESQVNADNSTAKPGGQELPDSMSAPIIYYDFTLDYLDKLLEKAGGMKVEEF